MEDSVSKTREQLVEELAEMRQRMAELEISEVGRKNAEEELRIVAALDRVRLSTYKMKEASDIQEVLVTLYGALRDVGLDFEGCSVQIVDDRKESFGIAWQAQHRPHSLDPSQKIPVTPELVRNSAVYEAWRSKRAVYRANLHAEDPYNERTVIRNAYGKDILSVLDVPFSQGTIAINHVRPDAFSETDIRTLERFAEALSEAFIRFEDIRGVAESEERYRRIVEHSQDVIFRVDLAGNYLFISPLIEELTGHAPKEFYAHWRIRYQIVLPEDIDILEKSFRKAFTGETSRDVEYRVRKTDGSILWMSQTTFPIRDWEGQVVAIEGVIRDITGHKQAEEELRKHRDHLEELVKERTAELTEINEKLQQEIIKRKRMQEELLRIQKLESVGMLAGGIAHDFNNILTAVVGNISLARMYEDPDKVTAKLMEAEKASLRAKDLTQQLLTFARGGAPIKTTASIADILRNSAIFALSGSDIRCEFSIPNDLWSVEVDKAQIAQVINNLLVNARQAMSEGGIIKVSVENVILGTEDALPLEDGEYVKISIQDQGVGIPEAHLQKIFDPYFTTKQKSSGLGLAASFSIIKSHNGYITAESQIGFGATFCVYLPANPQAILVREEGEEERPAIGKGRILVMDDEDMIRELASEMLDHIGYEVTTATDGTKAIELYQEARESGRPFDAVILDVTIAGGMGGKMAIQRLMEIDPEVRAIVSSGYSDDPIMADFRKYGFKGVIAKPYKIQELSEVLRKVVTDKSN